MSDQSTEDPSITRRLTDTALLIVAIAAIGSWVWRRLRRPAGVDAAPQGESQAVDDKAGSAPNNAPV